MSGVNILDSLTGRQARVTKNFQVRVQSESQPLQHYLSAFEESAYQSLGTATPTNGTTTVLHIENTSSTLSMVFTFIRLQAIALTGGTAVPNAANYWRFAFGRTWASGGTLATAVNVNRGSGKSAPATIYTGGPTLTGTALEFDRFYPTDQSQSSISKEGALILSPATSMEISFVGNNTGGTLYARASHQFRDLRGVI